MWVLRGSRVMRPAAAGQHDGAAAFALDRLRQGPAKGEAALRRGLRRDVGVDEDRQELLLARIATEFERDRKGGAEPGIQSEGRVEAEVEQLAQQGVAGGAVDRPGTLVEAAAFRAAAAMERKGRHAMHDHVVAMRVRQHDQEVGVERSEEHTSELQSRRDLVCRLLLEKK